MQALEQALAFVGRTLILAVLCCRLICAGQSTPKPDTPKPDATKTDATKTDATKSAVAKSDANKPVTAPISADWQTKSFDLRFADPEQLQALYSGRSFVIEADRELRVLTVHGSPAFLKEVEDTVKRYDVPPPPPLNVQLTVYLLTTAAQAPSGVAVPKELAAISKEFGPAPKLADLQVFRVREGQSGQVTSTSSKPEAASLSRVWVQSANVSPGAKGDLVSLNGLRIWLNIPANPPATTSGTLRADPDVSADIDIDPSQPVMVSKTGLEQPVMVVVSATVIR